MSNDDQIHVPRKKCCANNQTVDRNRDRENNNKAQDVAEYFTLFLCLVVDKVCDSSGEIVGDDAPNRERQLNDGIGQGEADHARNNQTNNENPESVHPTDIAKP